MHLLLCILMGALLAGCAHSPQSPIHPPSLKGGCLLPSPQIMDVSEANSVELLIRVSKNGDVMGTTILKSSGRQSLDMAFQKAAMDCSFGPANFYLPSTGQQIVVDGTYQLRYGWVAGQKFLGLSRCFPPEYPRESLQFDEEAKVYVDVRRLTPDAPFEYRVTSFPPTQRLADASLDAVRSCLAHPEAQVGTAIGRWTRIPITFRRKSHWINIF